MRCEGQNDIKWTKFCISFVPDKLSYFCEWWCYSYHWLTQALAQKQKCEGLPVGVNSTTWQVVLLMLYYIPLTVDITNQSKFDIILFLNFILTHNIYQTHDLTLRLINPLHPNISMHVLYTVLDTFFKVLTRRVF